VIVCVCFKHWFPVWHLRLFTADLILHSFGKVAPAERQSAFCLDANDSTANRRTLALVTSQIINSVSCSRFAE
jgi:hypothetical protein